MSETNWLEERQLMENSTEKEGDNESRKHSYISAVTGQVLDASICNSIAEANAKYARPKYNSQTRKSYYDDGKAHKKAIDRVFSSGESVKDPYSGAELLKKQKDAKLKFGEQWQKHAAEADHIDPLSQIAKRTEKNPFLTIEDIKEIGNREDNLQVISRESNQTSSMGKGGSSQKEWANNPKSMKQYAEKGIEPGKSIELTQKLIKKTGKVAERESSILVAGHTIKNIGKTAHEAGSAGAKSSASTAFTMSGIMNFVSVIKGEKDGKEAVADTIKDGSKAAVTGYVMSGGLTVVSQTLSYSSSEFIRGLAKANIPGKVINAIMVTGDTLKKWGEGEISTQECLITLGDKGLNMVTTGYSMAVGQALIPIPIVGGAIGALVGSVLTSGYYNHLINNLQRKELEHQERMRIIAECNVAAKQAKAFREELELYLNSYFQEYRECFDIALSSMQLAFQTGNADGMIAGANEITRKLGGNVQYETEAEFEEFLMDDSVDIL